MKIDQPPTSGSTNTRRAFWNQVTAAIKSAQKTRGRFVTVDEHEGKGTVINISDTSARRQAGGGGESCPARVQVQFSGIVFDCGCSLFSEGSTSSFLITDEGDANSFVTPMSLGSLGGSCGDCEGLKWFSGSGFGLSPHVLTSYWNEDSECSGTPSGTDFPQYFGMIMVLLSGTYYLVAYINFNLVFYGSTTDLNLPIANTLSCDLGFHDYSGDPAIACLFNGVLTPNLNSVAHGGTAIVTVL